MSENVKTRTQLAEDRAKLIAEAEELQTKSRTATLTTEEEQHLEKILADAEALDPEIQKAARDERIVAAKQRMAQPVKEAPRFSPQQYQGNNVQLHEAMALWFGAQMKGGDKSPEASYRARTAGFDLATDEVHIPFRWDGLNHERRRTILTTSGTGTGAELIYQTFASEVTKYMVYTSPLLGLLPVDTTADGNERTYYIVDDTALESSYTTASSGTEAAPTIPDVNIATAFVQGKAFDIVSGKHKVSFNELRDAGVNLPTVIAEAIGNSHRRKMENAIINSTGNGLTAPMGILNKCTAQTPVAAFDDDSIEALYFSLAQPYVENAIWLSNRATWAKVRKALKDDLNRSLFGTLAQDGIEYTLLKGKKYVVSEKCPNDTLAFFDPTLFTLRMVNGVGLKMFNDSAVWPATAWASLVSFGHVWRGSSSINCASKLTLSA